MKRALLCFITCYISAGAFSQPSDFLIIRKNQRTVKSFFAGSTISLETNAGLYSGQINAVQKDSLFVTQFDVRQVQTTLGFYYLDTVATYKHAFNYKDIIKIENQRTKGFNIAASGGSLFGGGILITAFGLGTWVFTKPGTQYYASSALVISAASLAGIGYLLLKSESSKYKIGKKYQLEYVKVK